MSVTGLDKKGIFVKKVSPFAAAFFAFGVSLIVNNATVAQDRVTTFSKTSPNTKNALVELFTSDGCDSCPPANKWLSSVVQSGSQSLIPVSMHVTYWNNLGWTDPASHAYFDQKQDHYARLGLARFSYTPAVFLSGSEWSGWRSNDLQNVKTINKQPAKIDISLKAERIDATLVRVQVELKPAEASSDANLSFAKQFVYLYEDALIDQPSAGELKGATLRHDHVVRKWDERQIEGWPNRTSIEFNVPQSLKNKKLGLVAFVQSQDGREIFQVIDLPLHDGS
jgi:hypothetical protein